jgi:hypothetical protein
MVLEGMMDVLSDTVHVGDDDGIVGRQQVAIRRFPSVRFQVLPANADKVIPIPGVYLEPFRNTRSTKVHIFTDGPVRKSNLAEDPFSDDQSGSGHAAYKFVFRLWKPEQQRPKPLQVQEVCALPHHVRPSFPQRADTAMEVLWAIVIIVVKLRNQWVPRFAHCKI